VFASGKPLQTRVMFVSKARYLLQSGAPVRVGSDLTHKHYTRLERLARYKESSLSYTCINYRHNKFYNIAIWVAKAIRLFPVIYIL
jgi:hypothetical protein